ncbi:MAG: hypothetical protein EOO53_20575 [Gammaproteobacteria bacterium]|nr:MAG: hypothetical protein EOO53_20575 [Gammaproteobacteria bacterium]
MFPGCNSLSSIAEEFFETHSEFLKEIIVLQEQRQFNLLKKISDDKNEINFFSWLAEVRFGLFFDKISRVLKNDHLIEGKTPDWILEMGDQKIMAEVLRLNTSEEEYKSSIAKNRQVRKFQKENPATPLVIKGTTKIISLEYLGGNQSKLVKKEETYRDIIRKHELPFIICVAPTIDTFLFELDFADFLLGNKGFFMRCESFRRNVTGVLLNTPFGGFFYFHNAHADFQLLPENFGKMPIYV